MVLDILMLVLLYPYVSCRVREDFLCNFIGSFRPKAIANLNVRVSWDRPKSDQVSVTPCDRDVLA